MVLCQANPLAAVVSMVEQAVHTPFLRKPRSFEMLNPFCQDAICALQIGETIYTLDYGLPQEFMRLDEYLRQRGCQSFFGRLHRTFEAAPDLLRICSRTSAPCARSSSGESDSGEYLNNTALSQRSQHV